MKIAKGQPTKETDYIRCPRCGFMNHKDRIVSSDMMNIGIVDIYQDVGPTKDGVIVLDNIEWLGSVGEGGYAARKVTINQGCAFCGNVNF